MHLPSVQNFYNKNPVPVRLGREPGPVIPPKFAGKDPASLNTITSVTPSQPTEMFGAKLRDVFTKVLHAPLTFRLLSVCVPDATFSLQSRYNILLKVYKLRKNLSRVFFWPFNNLKRKRLLHTGNCEMLLSSNICF